MGKKTKSMSCVLGLGSDHMRISNFHDVKWLKKNFSNEKVASDMSRQYWGW